MAIGQDGSIHFGMPGLNKVKTDATEAAKALDKLAKSAENAESAVQDLGSSVESSSVDASAKSVDKLTEKLEDLAKTASNTEKALEKVAGGMESSSSGNSSLKKKAEENAKALEQEAEAAKKVANATKKIADAESSVSNSGTRKDDAKALREQLRLLQSYKKWLEKVDALQDPPGHHTNMPGAYTLGKHKMLRMAVGGIRREGQAYLDDPYYLKHDPPKNLASKSRSSYVPTERRQVVKKVDGQNKGVKYRYDLDVNGNPVPFMERVKSGPNKGKYVPIKYSQQAIADGAPREFTTHRATRMVRGQIQEYEASDDGYKSSLGRNLYQEDTSAERKIKVIEDFKGNKYRIPVRKDKEFDVKFTKAILSAAKEAVSLSEHGSILDAKNLSTASKRVLPFSTVGANGQATMLYGRDQILSSMGEEGLPTNPFKYVSYLDSPTAGGSASITPKRHYDKDGDIDGYVGAPEPVQNRVTTQNNLRKQIDAAIAQQEEALLTQLADLGDSDAAKKIERINAGRAKPEVHNKTWESAGEAIEIGGPEPGTATYATEAADAETFADAAKTLKAAADVLESYMKPLHSLGAVGAYRGSDGAINRSYRVKKSDLAPALSDIELAVESSKRTPVGFTDALTDAVSGVIEEIRSSKTNVSKSLVRKLEASVEALYDGIMSDVKSIGAPNAEFLRSAVPMGAVGRETQVVDLVRSSVRSAIESIDSGRVSEPEHLETLLNEALRSSFSNRELKMGPEYSGDRPTSIFSALDHAKDISSEILSDFKGLEDAATNARYPLTEFLRHLDNSYPESNNTHAYVQAELSRDQESLRKWTEKHMHLDGKQSDSDGGVKVNNLYEAKVIRDRAKEKIVANDALESSEAPDLHFRMNLGQSVVEEITDIEKEFPALAKAFNDYGLELKDFAKIPNEYLFPKHVQPDRLGAAFSDPNNPNYYKNYNVPDRSILSVMETIAQTAADNGELGFGTDANKHPSWVKFSSQKNSRSNYDRSNFGTGFMTQFLTEMVGGNAKNSFVKGFVESAKSNLVSVSDVVPESFTADSPVITAVQNATGEFTKCCVCDFDFASAFNIIYKGLAAIDTKLGALTGISKALSSISANGLFKLDKDAVEAFYDKKQSEEADTANAGTGKASSLYEKLSDELKDSVRENYGFGDNKVGSAADRLEWVKDKQLKRSKLLNTNPYDDRYLSALRREATADAQKEKLDFENQDLATRVKQASPDFVKEIQAAIDAESTSEGKLKAIKSLMHGRSGDKTEGASDRKAYANYLSEGIRLNTTKQVATSAGMSDMTKKFATSFFGTILGKNRPDLKGAMTGLRRSGINKAASGDSYNADKYWRDSQMSRLQQLSFIQDHFGDESFRSGLKKSDLVLQLEKEFETLKATTDESSALSDLRKRLVDPSRGITGLRSLSDADYIQQLFINKLSDDVAAEAQKRKFAEGDLGEPETAKEAAAAAREKAKEDKKAAKEESKLETASLKREEKYEKKRKQERERQDKVFERERKRFSRSNGLSMSDSPIPNLDMVMKPLTTVSTLAESFQSAVSKNAWANVSKSFGTVLNKGRTEKAQEIFYERKGILDQAQADYTEKKSNYDALSKSDKASPEDVARAKKAVEEAEIAYNKALSTMSKMSSVYLGEVAKAAGGAAMSIGKLASSFVLLKPAASVLKITGKMTRGLLEQLTFARPFVDAFKSVNGVVGKLVRQLSGFVRYRMLREIFMGLASSAKQGIDNLYQWAKANGKVFAKTMDNIATNFLYIKNSAAAAVSPIINFFAGASNSANGFVSVLDRVTEALVNFFNMMNQAFAKLTGATTWTRAKKQAIEYQNAAKKALYLAPFDEINKLDEKDGTTPDYATLFEDVAEFYDNPILNFIDRMKQAFEDGGFLGMGIELADELNAIVDSFDAYGWGRKIGEKIEDGIDFLYGFFKTFDWKKLGQRLAELINGIIIEVDPKRFGTLLAAKFSAAIRILGGFLDHLNWKGVFTFGALAIRGAFDELTDALESSNWGEIGHKIGDAIKSINWTDVFKSIGTFIGESTKDLINFFTPIISGLARAFKDTEWHEVLGAVIDKLGEIDWSDVMRALVDLISAAWAPVATILVLRMAGAFIKEIGASFVTGMGILNPFTAIGESMALNLMTAFETGATGIVGTSTALGGIGAVIGGVILGGLAVFIGTNVAPKIADAIANAAGAISDVVTPVIDGIIEKLTPQNEQGNRDILSDLFNNDMLAVIDGCVVPLQNFGSAMEFLNDQLAAGKIDQQLFNEWITKLSEIELTTGGVQDIARQVNDLNQKLAEGKISNSEYDSAIKDLKESYEGLFNETQELGGFLSGEFATVMQSVYDKFHETANKSSELNATASELTANFNALADSDEEAAAGMGKVTTGSEEAKAAVERVSDVISVDLFNSFASTPEEAQKNFDALVKVIDDALTHIKESVSAAFGVANSDSVPVVISDALTAVESNFESVFGSDGSLVGKVRSCVEDIKNEFEDLSKLSIELELDTKDFDLGDGGATTVEYPKGLSVHWMATGGILDSATLIGAGEAGKEAVLPLDRNTGWMDSLANRVWDSGKANAIDDQTSVIYDGFMQVISAIQDQDNSVYIGDDVIGRANQRYVNKLSRAKGVMI